MTDYRADYRSTDPTKSVGAELRHLKATEFHPACAEARAVAERHPYIRAVNVWSEDGGEATFPVNVPKSDR